MPLLTELANEILYQIIDQIDPADIYSFSQSCSHFRQLTKETLALHEDRMEKYRCNFVHGCHRHQYFVDPLQLMYEIYMDWKVGSYVRHLDVRCCNHTPDAEFIADLLLEQAFDEEDIQTYKAEKKSRDVFNERIMGLLQDYIVKKYTESGFSYSTRFPIDEVCSEVKKGDTSAMVGLLIWLIPQLRILYLSQYGRKSRYLYEAIKTITEQGHTKPGTRKPLTKLVQVEILGPEGDPTDEQFDFDHFALFMALPSMKHLGGHSVRGLVEHPVMWAHLPLHASNVIVICLVDSVVTAECFKLMLETVNSLKDFSYCCAEGNGMEAHKIIAALHEHAKHSLELLCLQGNVPLNLMDDEIPSRSLRDFEVMKECRIPSAAYLGLLPWRGRSPEGELYLQDMQPLVCALPRSIEEVDLFYTRTYPELDHASGFLNHLIEEKEQRLPLLKGIRIRNHFSRRQHDEDSFKLEVEMCARVGVTLRAEWSGIDDGEEFPISDDEEDVPNL